MQFIDISMTTSLNGVLSLWKQLYQRILIPIDWRNLA